MASDKERDPGSSSAEIGKYLDILAKDPNSRVFAPLAEAYRKAGLFDDAVEIALEGLKVHPNYLGGRVALGRAYFEKKQYADAAAEMQKVAKSAPDNIIAHKVLGQIAYSQNDLPAAEKAFKMVLLLDPRDQEAQQFITNLAGGGPAVQAPVPAAVPVPTPEPIPVPEPIPIPAPARVTAPIETTPTIPPQPSQPPPASLPERPQATETVQPPAAAQPVTPPSALSPSAPPSIEEIQSIDDLDLQVDDIFGAAVPGEAFHEPYAPEPPVAPALPDDEPPEPDAGMELEVFSRSQWRADAALEVSPSPSPPPPPSPSPSPSPPAVAAEAADSPFEVFGRSKRGGQPQSDKGEREAFGEIDFASKAPEPERSEPAPAADSQFEIFTREPGFRATPAPAKPERGAAAGPREMDVETTAYMPPDIFASAGVDIPVPSLDEELPRDELTQEIVFGAPDELPSPPVAPESKLGWEPMPEPVPEPMPELVPELVPEPMTEPVPEPVPEPMPVPELVSETAAEVRPGPGTGIDLEFDLEPDAFTPQSSTPPETAVLPEPAAAPIEIDVEEPRRLEDSDQFDLGEEPPSVDSVRESRLGSAGEGYEEAVSEQEPPAAARGVFDTETLASIYINQGFYGRAAEIYQRLVTQRPEDAGLRGKLENVLALERGDAGHEKPAAAVAAAVERVSPPALVAPARGVPAAAPRMDSERTISRLQTLLETFKGGRPR